MVTTNQAAALSLPSTAQTRARCGCASPQARAEIDKFMATGTVELEGTCIPIYAPSTHIKVEALVGLIVFWKLGSQGGSMDFYTFCTLLGSAKSGWVMTALESFANQEPALFAHCSFNELVDIAKQWAYNRRRAGVQSVGRAALFLAGSGVLIAGAVVAAPLAFTATIGMAGFGTGGILAGSPAAAFMATYGGSVGAGSLCAGLQSIGAAGLGATGTGIAGSVGGVFAAGATAAARKFSTKRSHGQGPVGSSAMGDSNTVS
ncbi:hypothetical protein HDU86_001808 [Geranomyces michiganensis]|nr:hypothetical protein HDU86_001808 [Geranomyces michiganensis]